MNIRGGIAVIKVQLFGFLSTKGFFWTLALGWMTGPLIYLLVWSTAASDGVIGGYDRNGFILYYLSLIVINQFTYPTSHWSTGEAITTGFISTNLLRPLPLVYNDIGCDLATKIVCMPFVIIVVFILGFLFNVTLVFSISVLPIALCALLLSMMVRFLLAHFLALLAFWIQKSDSILSVNDTFIFLFSGQVAPLTLFPTILRDIVSLLPYRYMVAFPIEIFMGMLSEREIFQGLIIQGSWLVILIIICKLITKSGIKKYSATGG